MSNLFSMEPLMTPLRTPPLKASSEQLIIYFVTVPSIAII